MKARGLKAGEAERAFERWLVAQGWNVHRARASRARIGNKFVTHSHDIFGCIDVLAIRRDYDTWAAQITTASGRTARRRKLEAIDWPSTWRVSLVTHERTEDPVDRRKSREFWRIEDLVGGSWLPPLALEAGGQQPV